MLLLDDPGLDSQSRQGLAGFQTAVDGVGDYGACVATAKELFPKRNRSTNPVFRVVRRQLREMCAGAQRCAYCEDSVGDEVEHIRPKDLYPEVVFVWENYVLSCGPCNTGKSNKFAVIDAQGDLIEVTRKPRAPVLPPAAGEPALINPRTENPLDFLDLEIVETFFFLSRDDIQDEALARADFTIDILKLNRDVLLNARRNAFGSYRARLVEYKTRYDSGATEEELATLVLGIKKMSHPTVWEEMKRQHELVPDLKTLFEEIPEALDW